MYQFWWPASAETRLRCIRNESLQTMAARCHSIVGRKFVHYNSNLIKIAEIIGDLGDYLGQIGDLGTPVPPKILGIWGKSRRLLGIWIIWGTPVPSELLGIWGKSHLFSGIGPLCVHPAPGDDLKP